MQQAITSSSAAEISCGQWCNCYFCFCSVYFVQPDDNSTGVHHDSSSAKPADDRKFQCDARGRSGIALHEKADMAVILSTVDGEYAAFVTRLLRKNCQVTSLLIYFII